MNQKNFQRLVEQGFNRIPVAREMLADFDTPLSTYLKLADAPYSYLLESVHGGEKWGRYSIIGLPCRKIIRVRGQRVTVEHAGEIVESLECPDPLAWIQEFQSRYRVPATGGGLPRFIGGLVGYFSYDTIRYIEPKLAHCPNPDPLDNPDILLLVSEDVVVFDNLAGRLYLITLVDPAVERAYSRAQQRLDDWSELLRTPRSLYAPYRTRPAAEEIQFVSGFTKTGYENAVERIKDYILAGDCMQVVPSQRLSAPFKAPPLDLYRALRGLNPSPYMYFLNLGDVHIVGSSPEILTRLEDGLLTVRPIAGTRWRGATEAEDQALAAELLADPKELAEHLMLIDLGRNDVGRVSEIGSVRLTEKMVVERYSHVMHIVSNVTGRLRPGLTAIDALRATFPAGTVSGAPKIRAMEIIDELEPVKRGIYAGAVGYLSWSGNMDTAIAIRTAVLKDGMLHIQAGGGVVADSVPQNEWEETMNKGRALFRAAALAEQGLDEPRAIGEKI
ncbi:anthranilate synthase component I [Candidatus Competibacter denitrificans Run_A_D11]|uniref:Anthranilate synthase component 1 n=1 Tax=Candidatus Competibacter denitrificans Run_A_D11 TaxID=1400863 RepID=W6M5S3_9GAMM|nr:anthranilate synthase component I [Candidatus Competibacter denitrificans]CDI03077.1 anthranilate synthase component I [Candidatus Competibacter denitrificans Run_A_D11]HRC68748.1 anthranilate synthase component I [Candidatus Competibacter denitrificans]